MDQQEENKAAEISEEKLEAVSGGGIGLIYWYCTKCRTILLTANKAGFKEHEERCDGKMLLHTDF